MNSHITSAGHRREKFLQYRKIMATSQAARLAFGSFPHDLIYDIQLRHLKEPLALRPSTSDVRVLKQVFLDEEYKMPYPINPKVIVDGGANIGLATRYYRSRYPDAVIHAVEPEEENFKLLKRNCLGQENVHLYHAAIWPLDGIVGLVNDLHEPWAFACVGNPEQGQLTSRAMTMASIIDECGGTVDLLKLDIEGAEKFLFETDSMLWLPKVKILVIELHDYLFPDCAKTFFTALQGLQYRLDVRGENIIVQFSE